MSVTRCVSGACTHSHRVYLNICRTEKETYEARLHAASERVASLGKKAQQSEQEVMQLTTQAMQSDSAAQQALAQMKVQWLSYSTPAEKLKPHVTELNFELCTR